MSYDRLLQATIEYLKRLNTGGTRFIPVSSAARRVLRALAQTPSPPNGGVRLDRSTGRIELQATIPISFPSSPRGPTAAEMVAGAVVSGAAPPTAPLSPEAKEAALTE